jgi:hypothetical protein
VQQNWSQTDPSSGSKCFFLIHTRDRRNHGKERKLATMISIKSTPLFFQNSVLAIIQNRTWRTLLCDDVFDQILSAQVGASCKEQFCWQTKWGTLTKTYVMLPGNI